MKIGQIMSYIDVALPAELRAALSALQTASPPMPWETVRAIVSTELGDRAPALLSRMEPVPVAAASIGQVHRATLSDGTRVAVKARYPDIDKAIAADFVPASLGGTLASIIYPGAKVDAMLHELRERILTERDYAAEARAQLRFCELYADHPVIVVPKVMNEFCAARVLTTAWIDGASFDAYLERDPPQEERDRVGAALFEFYIGTLFRHGLYNCDPHPGNYLFIGDGRVAMLDYGCTRSSSPEFLGKLASLTQAVRADTHAALHAAFVDLGMVRQGKAYDFDTARALVRGSYGPMLRDEVIAVPEGQGKGMREIARDKRALVKLTLPGEFL